MILAIKTKKERDPRVDPYVGATLSTETGLYRVVAVDGSTVVTHGPPLRGSEDHPDRTDMPTPVFGVSARGARIIESWVPPIGRWGQRRVVNLSFWRDCFRTAEVVS
jgi:hypothetical protein